jgi:DNA-binding SARP family transcriptional activator/tetratricopeptide (TPR) repeat protein
MVDHDLRHAGGSESAAATFRLEVLGPVAAWRDGAPVPLGSVRQRAVFALLALHAGAGMSRTAIVDALWHDQPPATAVAMVQGCIMGIRRVLRAAEARGCMTSKPDGALLWDGACYRLAPGAVRTDMAEFAELCERARQAAAADPAEACRLYEQALQTWRGDPLADIEFLRGHPVVTEIRRRRGDVAADYAVVAEAIGMHEPVLPHLLALTAREPLDERAHARLMIALAATGQQAAALRVYEDLRRRLDDELGMRPGQELADAHLAVLRQQTARLRPPQPGAAKPAAAAAEPADARPAAPARPVPRQLPAAVHHFAGRARELTALTGLLDRAASKKPKTVVISAIGGTAGVGKTALAVHWSYLVAGRFPDGQIYINLRGFGPTGTPVAPADAMHRMLGMLGVPARQLPSSAEAQQDLYRSLLADRRMLIVLDNARDAEQVRPLLPGGPSCVVLVTSRSQLTSLVVSEGAHPVNLDVLSAADARELLVRRLGAERVAADPNAATQLAELCARLPLAIAIAAARAAVQPALPLGTLVTELEETSSRLDALDAGEDASMRAVLSWSYGSLDEPTARIFRLLGMHPGPDITAAAAASLAGVSPGQAHQTLQQLARANLLTEHHPGRFTFHDLLRAYAAERAAAEDAEADRCEATHRMLDHYLHTMYAAAAAVYRDEEAVAPGALAPGATPEVITGYDQAMAWFDAEHRVLAAALSQAASAGFDSHAWQLPSAMAIFFFRRGYWRESAAMHRTALAAATRLGDRDGQALAHRNLGHVSILLGAYQEAQEHLQRALTGYRALGSLTGEARVHVLLGGMCERQGRYCQALAHSQQALAVYRSTGNAVRQAHVLNNVGWCYALLEDYQQALGYCRRALDLHQEHRDRPGEAYVWDSLGYAHHRLGENAEAVFCYRQSVALFRELDDHFNQADKLVHLGNALDADHRPEPARKAWREALAVFDELRHPNAGLVRAKLEAAD